jgi:ATP-binding cassette, subfamily B, multidrug efflux pump
VACIEIAIEDQEARFNKRHFKRLLGFARPYGAKMAAAVGFITIGSAAQVSIPWLIQRGIDHHIVAGDAGGLLRISTIFLAVILVYLFTHRRRIYLMSWVGQHVLYGMRRTVFGHMQRLGFRFFESQPTGKIISRLTSDVRHLQEFLANGLIQMVSESLLIVGILVAMLLMHTQLALLSLATLPLVMITVAALRRRIRQANIHERDTMANIYANVQESIAGVRHVQAHARQSVNERHFDKVNNRNLEAALTTARRAGLLAPAVEVTSALAVSLVLWYGVLTVYGDVAGDPISVGVLVAFLAYLQQFYDPIRDLSNVYNLMQAAMASADRIFGVLDTEPQVQERDGAVELPAVRGEVSLEKVTFAYHPGRPVLHEVDLQVQPGETVALVGATGAGKTTLTNLIARFYDPTSGAVRIDGHDLRDVTLASLRRPGRGRGPGALPVLAHGARQPGFGRPDATDEQVVAAAKAVRAHDFICALPHGYDTAIHERGDSLSNGQRQLLAFARALVLDPQGARARRGDLQRRREHRGAAAASRRPAAGRPHRLRGRAPAVDDPRRRPDRGRRRRPHPADRLARRARPDPGSLPRSGRRPSTVRVRRWQRYLDATGVDVLFADGQDRLRDGAVVDRVGRRPEGCLGQVSPRQGRLDLGLDHLRDDRQRVEVQPLHRSAMEGFATQEDRLTQAQVVDAADVVGAERPGQVRRVPAGHQVEAQAERQLHHLHERGQLVHLRGIGHRAAAAGEVGADADELDVRQA